MHLNSSHVFSSLSFHTRTLGSNFLRRLFVALNRISITNSLCFDYNMHSFLRNYLSQKSGCVLYMWADQPASFPEVTKRDQSSTWRSANSTRLVVEEYTSATSTDFVVRVFTPLKCYAYRRPFHWGQWGKRFFEKKSQSPKMEHDHIWTTNRGTMVEFFLKFWHGRFPLTPQI